MTNKLEQMGKSYRPLLRRLHECVIIWPKTGRNETYASDHHRTNTTHKSAGPQTQSFSVLCHLSTSLDQQQFSNRAHWTPEAMPTPI